MALLDFVRRGPSEVTPLFVHHRTKDSDLGLKAVELYCEEHSLHLLKGSISTEKNTKDGYEAFWRSERYSIFHAHTMPVLTAHQLDDCVEEYIINTLKRGRLGIIPYRNQNVIRPIRLTSHQRLLDWCMDNDVPFVHDSTNYDSRFLRPRIRYQLLEQIENLINPGIVKMVKKMILADDIQ